MRERANLTSKREMGEEPAEEGQDLHHHQQPDQEIAGGQTSQPGEGCHEEEISCGISMHIRMPGPVVQASQGGTCPAGTAIRPVTNTTNLLRQPVLRWPVNKGEENTKEVTAEQEDGPGEERLGCLVEGAEDSDRETYRKFLEYCEERRRSWDKQVEEDEERMKRCKREMEHWALLKESMRFLKENEKGWQMANWEDDRISRQQI